MSEKGDSPRPSAVVTQQPKRPLPGTGLIEGGPRTMTDDAFLKRHSLRIEFLHVSPNSDQENGPPA